jgi:hypothetical protein
MLLMMAVMDCLWVSSERRKTSAMALQGSDQGPPYKEGNQYMYIYICYSARVIQVCACNRTHGNCRYDDNKKSVVR